MNLRRPRKLYPRKPSSYTTPHQTRMILPICLRHPTINSKQTWRCPCTPILHSSINSSTTTTHLKTTRANIPPHHPIPILNPSSRHNYPNMNWRHTSRTSLHHYWTNCIRPILRTIPHFYATSRMVRK
uniref:Uncharacterized protein n=1 Tax=Cyprinus carpio carpio TaxID=630221 RepID=A0A9J8ADG6_CYPCA